MRALFTSLLIILIINFFSCSQNKSDNSDKNDKPTKSDTVKRTENSLTRSKLNGKVKSVTTSTFDVIEKFGDIEEGNYKGNEIDTYDENGFNIESNYFLPNDKLSYKEIPKYNEYGNCIEINRYLPDGKFFSKNVSRYNDKGLFLEENEYDNNGKLTDKYLAIMDESGKRSEKKHYNALGDLVDFADSYKFNDRGEVIGYIVYKSDGVVEGSYTYEHKDFDAKGNWLKEIAFKNKIATTIVKREIIYY